ncbi:MAG: helix-turn-helix domain-containing protein [Bacilli bacterium]
MNYAEIIRNERKKRGITQEELAKDICSASHLSKLETGVPGTSDEVIELLLKKLNISIEDVKERYITLEQTLNSLSTAISYMDEKSAKKLMGKIDTMVDEFNHSPYDHMRLLMQFRYYLYVNNRKKATSFFNKISKIQAKLSRQEIDLHNHMMGVYYYSEKEYVTALRFLKDVSASYPEDETAYHLSNVYLALGSRILAYEYAMRAYQKFKKENNSRRIIEVQLIMNSRYIFLRMIASVHKKQSTNSNL